MNKKNVRATRSLFEYRDDRARDLHEVFKREFGAVPGEDIKSLMRRVVNSPSRRFWVSEECAFRTVSSMLHSGMHSRCSSIKREMFEEISRRCRQLLDTHPDWPLSRCVYYVVNRSAPKFYLSAKRAYSIILRERERCEREKIQTLLRFRRSLSA